jgi:hypothetical protein
MSMRQNRPGHKCSQRATRPGKVSVSRTVVPCPNAVSTAKVAPMAAALVLLALSAPRPV